MSSHRSQIKSYMGLSAIVSLYGIASLLVVFLGPSLGIGFAFQIIIIVLLLLTWPFAILIMHFRKRRMERKAAKESGTAPRTTADLNSGTGPGAAASRVPSRVYDELARGVEEVVQWLRNTKLNAVRRRDPAYTLPWFLVAGAPGSGKTSLLLSSGLDFHALPSQRRADQNVIRSTRDVDWRVTDWCVFLDSTGRYQTEGPDGDEWTALVDTVVKYRKRRPIDGLVITADAGRLLASGEAEIEQQAKILRARLDQLNAQVKARFPVYLVFTHAESLEGFEEFFRLPDAAERGQVWGTTIPLDQSGSAHALFDVEFDYLYDTLMRHRLLRLSAQESAAEQLMVFDFPLRFAEARRRLGLFTSALFRPNPFSESPLLRGFYFTSSAPSNGSGHGASSGPLDAPGTLSIVGEGCFSDRLFNDVLLRDRNLAASFQQGRNNPARLRNVLLGVAGALAVFVMAGLIASFVTNVGLMSEGNRIGSALAARAKRGPEKDAGIDSRYELQDIERLRELLVRLDGYNRDWIPIYFHRFGLYQGKRLTPYLRAIYFDAISRRFFNPMIVEVEKRLQSPPPPSSPAPGAGAGPNTKADEEEEQKNPLESYYDLLKAYLMLSKKPDQAEASLLNEQFKEFWTRSATGEEESLAFEQLEFFAQASAESSHESGVRDIAPPRINASEDLIREACRALQSYPAEQRYYRRAIDDISARTKAVTLPEMIGGATPLLNGAATVRGAFTIDGYKQMLKVIDAAQEEVSKDWVCPNSPSEKDIKVDKARLTAQYANQYIDAWRKFLRKVRVRDYNSPDDAVLMLYELSKDDSQLAQVLKEVERQTNIPRSTGSFLDKINIFSSKPSGGKDDVASTVKRAFQPLIGFVVGDGDQGGAKMKEYLNGLTQARDALDQARAGESEGLKRFLNDSKGGLPTIEARLKPGFADFGKTTGGTEAAKVLVQPLDNLKSLLARESSEQIETKWINELYETAHQFEQRYPFVDSQNEASLTDIGRFFNPVDGQFWVFFNDNLKPSFEQAQGLWRPKEGSNRVRVSDAFVSYLNAAQRLTSALFPDGTKTAALDFQLMIQPSPSATVEVQVGGKWVDVSSTLVPVRSTDSGGAVRVSQGINQVPYNLFQGYWWPLRMIEKGGASRSGDGYKLGFKVASVTANATLKPTSAASNPFDRTVFRSLQRPPQHIR